MPKKKIKYTKKAIQELKKQIDSYNMKTILHRHDNLNLGRFYSRIDEEDPAKWKKSATTLDGVISKGEPYDKWLGNAKSYEDACEYRDLKAHQGTVTHAFIDELVQGWEVDLSQGWKMDGKYGEYIQHLPNRINKMVMSFVAWWNEKEPIAIASELQCFHDDVDYCGTADLFCIIKDKLCLVDYKTGGQYKSHELQLTQYKMVWDKIFPDFPIDELYCLYLKDGWRLKPGYSFKKWKYVPTIVNSANRIWNWFHGKNGKKPIPKQRKEYPNVFKIERSLTNE